jgi:UDP-N-acetylmuramoyl-L-alanyl-D-glutamate--2,6-diaminopimelate ligase
LKGKAVLTEDDRGDIVMRLKRHIKKILPESLILRYHFVIAVLAGWYYRNPSNEMLVIGVTGTKGKTSTSHFIWSCLNQGQSKAGLISTATIYLGGKQFINDYHMTMPGRFMLQSMLRQMVNNGCRYCIVETSSEGVKQWRHKGINYDVAVFTNLYPEHLTAHGNFENYKKAKSKLFKGLTRRRKVLDKERVKKIIIANNDDEHKDYFLDFDADKKVTYGTGEGSDLRATNILSDEKGVSFDINGDTYGLNVIGEFNVHNALPALAVAREVGLTVEDIKKGLARVRVIPGRMEKIEEGQKFMAIVDYAHEEQSLRGLLETVQEMKKEEDSRVIILYGAAGGGRDKEKRRVMARIAARKADVVIVSNQDPYYDNPHEILEDIASYLSHYGKKKGKDLFVIDDRREGIKKAVSLAKDKDIVLIVGKGSDQAIIVEDQRLKWDDRTVLREEIRAVLSIQLRDSAMEKDNKKN